MSTDITHDKFVEGKHRRATSSQFKLGRPKSSGM